MSYLLDTNVWIAVLRHPTSSLVRAVPGLLVEDWQVP
jgi:predicted nucleic acid-binding protein